jgi:hypothetical protein
MGRDVPGFFDPKFDPNFSEWIGSATIGRMSMCEKYLKTLLLMIGDYRL